MAHRSTAETSFVRLSDGGVAAYRCYGFDGPPVVLLHGLAATGDVNWENVAMMLAEKYRVIVLDLRGHGRSRSGRQKFSFAACARDLDAVREALKLDMFTLVGYSMGGAVAQTYARMFQTNLRGMVMLATAPVFLGGRVTTRTRRRLTVLRYLAACTPLRIRQHVSSSLYLRHEARNWSAEQQESIRGHDWLDVLRAACQTLRYDSRAWLGDIDMPTAVIVTSRDEAVPPEEQEYLVEHLQTVAVTRIDTSHDPMRHNHDTILAALRSSIDAVIAADVRGNGDTYRVLVTEEDADRARRLV